MANGTAVAGLRGTGDWSPDERPKNFREGILFFNPAGTAPLFALTSKAGKKTVDDPEFSWWNEGKTLVRLQIADGGVTAAATQITVTGTEPSPTALGANFGSAFNLKQGDLLLVEPQTGDSESVAYDREIMEVVNVLSATQFTVIRGAAGTTANVGVIDSTTALPTFLQLIGSAYAEGTGAPRAVTRNPIKFSNLTQIFKDTFELTGTADKTKTRTNNNHSTDKQRKMFKHSSDIELAMLFGRRAEIVGENGKPKRYMAGLRSLIPNVTIFPPLAATPGALSPDTFLDALSPCFDHDTGAGDTRIVFAGNQALINLSKMFADEVTFNVNNVIKMYGMDFQEFILPMGRILLKSHPLLSRNSYYNTSAFVCDFDAIKYVNMRDRDTKVKDDVQLEDEDVRRGFIQTECSLMLDYGGLTMAYLGNIKEGTA